MALSAKRQRFVEEYLVDLNAAAAYRRAGYTARSDNVAAVEGHRLLSDPKIAAAISAAQAARSERTLITADEVIQGLKAEATRMGGGSSHGARVAAWVALGKHLALFVDRQRSESGVVLEVVEELVDAGNPGAKAQDRPPAPRPG